MFYPHRTEVELFCKALVFTSPTQIALKITQHVSRSHTWSRRRHHHPKPREKRRKKICLSDVATNHETAQPSFAWRNNSKNSSLCLYISTFRFLLTHPPGQFCNGDCRQFGGEKAINLLRFVTQWKITGWNVFRWQERWSGTTICWLLVQGH